MAQKQAIAKIPVLNPSQFDEYLFGTWKPVVSKVYDQFHIERVEHYKTHLQLPLQPHRRLVYFMIFLTKGKVLRSKGLTQYEIGPNTLFALPSDQITSIESVSEDAEGYYLHFLPEIFQQKRFNLPVFKELPFFQLTGNPVFELIENKQVIELFELILQEYKKNQPERFELLPLYLTTLLTEFKLQEKSQPRSLQNAATHLTQRYKDALSSLIYEKKSVQEFAEYLSVSPNHLHKSVKITTGKSAHELLEEMRILEAKVLLSQTDLSIGEIAFRLGKVDPSDFSRFFKAKTLLTPKQYRNNSN
ncbi:AraC family transcriptional regulator [Cellulophaga sp. BC115SP]|uniref:helix-turn-helix domain-containing protein n=1 Tax=Cellulophaga sp. BC115SP TaxID=2683263 RepID=UPI001411B547|nr:AraC family transcriptional regulator [Cellulophaga sp. BC115SP]NBB29762.1 helix-turn-helix domain-containing protein [Cellulophaga sp. BC115SP]